MSIFIGVCMVVAALIALPLVAALLVKSEFCIVREVTIDKPRHEVFSYIRMLRNHQQFNKWVMADPDMKNDFRGTDGTVGFVSAWESDDKNVGKGEQEIKQITEGERIEYELRFQKPFEGKALAHLRTSSVSENQTTVTWGFRGTRNYPMKVMRVIINMDKMLANDLRASLGNLKGTLEKA